MIGEICFLSVEDVIEIHADQISRYGGEPAVRDAGLLASAVHAPLNVAAYLEGADLCDMAAAYMFHISENQPFIDGNKRAAVASALVFLHQNGIQVLDPGEALYETMPRVAEKAIGKPEIASVLRALISVTDD